VFDEAKQYCEKKKPNMMGDMSIRGRAKDQIETTTFLHHYYARIFFAVLDKIYFEMHHRFRKSTIKMLACFYVLI
jgi:hypothetical protein